MKEFAIPDGFIATQRCGRKQQCQRDQARIAELKAENARLREALGGLGVIGDGYCFCNEHRDPHKEQHQPECRLARAALGDKQ